MQELYGRHFLAPFGSFDAIPDQDQPAIDPHRAWKQPQHGPRPQGRKPIKLDAAAVKVIEQLGVEAWPQVQGAYDAGDAEQFHPHRQAGHGIPGIIAESTPEHPRPEEVWWAEAAKLDFEEIDGRHWILIKPEVWIWPKR